MDCVPCSLCGYNAPEASCPHCRHAPHEPTLARRAPRAANAVIQGMLAVPRGLGFLLRTRGTKRWLLPPFLITAAALTLTLTATFRWVDRWRDESLPKDLAWEEVDWLSNLAENWGWVHSIVAAVVMAAEWVVELVLGVLTSGPFSWLAGFLVASLVFWYAFSIFYEAIAGPFLDEIHGRLEARWFGADPRSSLERPNDLPASTCARLTGISALLGAAAATALWFSPWSSLWMLPAAIAPFLALGALRPAYGQWLAWVARIEGGALWVGIQASIITGVILVIALPLYLVPAVGYFLYAGVTGFATAIALLDIATERRGWSLRQRLRFVRRHLLALTSFGIASGALLAIPIIGPILVVPSASVGGLWLLCRLDKSFLRPPNAGGDFPREFPPGGSTVAAK